LIQQGAKPALSAADILEELGLGGGGVADVPTKPGPRSPPLDCTPLQRALWQALEAEARHVDALLAAVRTDLGAGPADILSALTELELRGVVRQQPGMVFGLA
jgi:predicted Rossmann fold nucleotide-binding protein DprA/Smf involved in DNA uptake